MTSKTCYEKWVDGVTGESLVRDAAHLSLRHRLNAVLHFLNLAANHSSENVEYVHLLRVWTRRSTAALRLYTRVLPKKELRSIRRKLERIRRAAGDARDLDVFLGQIVDEESCQSSSFANRVRRQREKAQRPIKKCFERAHRRRRLQKLLDKILEKIPNNVESSRLVRDWAHVALRNAVERFYCAFPSDSNDLQAIHRFRARVKDLRYAIELLVAAYPIELKSFVYPIVEELQELLGNINDRSVAISRLDEWHARYTRNRDRAKLKQKWARETEKLNEALANFRGWWTLDIQSQILDSLYRLTETVPSLEAKNNSESVNCLLPPASL